MYINDSCMFFGSSLNGRQYGTKKLINVAVKAPIIIEESNDIIFFPTGGSASEKCSWISLNHVEKYEPYKGYTKVTFTEGKTIVLKMSCSSFEMQLLRATRLQNLIKKRLDK